MKAIYRTWDRAEAADMALAARAAGCPVKLETDWFDPACPVFYIIPV